MKELIDKAEVVAEIKKRIKEIDEIGTYLSPKGVLTNLLCHLDTLEVKEVDLDFQRFSKEMEFVFSLPSSKTENTEENPLIWEHAIAKHFFELGLKANNLWHDAQGDDLPEIDREVIVLRDDGHGGYEVCFAHRPNKKGYLGKSLVTGNVETFYPHTYGKGGWNIPDARWWLDVEIPNWEE